MKNLIISLICIVLISSAASAETAQTTEDNKGVIAVQKQPTNKEQQQKITRNIGCIIIQINGKTDLKKANNKSVE